MAEIRDECLAPAAEMMTRALRDLTLRVDPNARAHVETSLNLIGDDPLRRSILDSEIDGQPLHELITQRFGPDVVQPYMERPAPPANVTEIPAGGDVIKSNADVLVQTIPATSHVTGDRTRGLEDYFRKQFPDNFEQYRQAAREGRLKAGDVFVTEQMVDGRPVKIVNIATKGQYAVKEAKREDIQRALDNLANWANENNIESMAMPVISTRKHGMGASKHDVDEVRGLINEAAAKMPRTQVEVYQPKPMGERAQSRVASEVDNFLDSNFSSFKSDARAGVADIVNPDGESTTTTESKEVALADEDGIPASEEMLQLLALGDQWTDEIFNLQRALEATAEGSPERERLENLIAGVETRLEDIFASLKDLRGVGSQSEAFNFILQHKANRLSKEIESLPDDDEKAEKLLELQNIMDYLHRQQFGESSPEVQRMLTAERQAIETDVEAIIDNIMKAVNSPRPPEAIASDITNNLSERESLLAEIANFESAEYLTPENLVEYGNFLEKFRKKNNELGHLIREKAMQAPATRAKVLGLSNSINELKERMKETDRPIADIERDKKRLQDLESELKLTYNNSALLGRLVDLEEENSDQDKQSRANAMSNLKRINEIIQNPLNTFSSYAEFQNWAQNSYNGDLNNYFNENGNVALYPHLRQFSPDQQILEREFDIAGEDIGARLIANKRADATRRLLQNPEIMDSLGLSSLDKAGLQFDLDLHRMNQPRENGGAWTDEAGRVFFAPNEGQPLQEFSSKEALIDALANKSTQVPEEKASLLNREKVWDRYKQGVEASASPEIKDAAKNIVRGLTVLEDWANRREGPPSNPDDLFKSARSYFGRAKAGRRLPSKNFMEGVESGNMVPRLDLPATTVPESIARNFGISWNHAKSNFAAKDYASIFDYQKVLNDNLISVQEKWLENNPNADPVRKASFALDKALNEAIKAEGDGFDPDTFRRAQGKSLVDSALASVDPKLATPALREGLSQRLEAWLETDPDVNEVSSTVGVPEPGRVTRLPSETNLSVREIVANRRRSIQENIISDVKALESLAEDDLGAIKPKFDIAQNRRGLPVYPDTLDQLLRVQGKDLTYDQLRKYPIWQQLPYLRLANDRAYIKDANEYLNALTEKSRGGEDMPGGRDFNWDKASINMQAKLARRQDEIKKLLDAGNTAEADNILRQIAEEAILESYTKDRVNGIFKDDATGGAEAFREDMLEGVSPKYYPEQAMGGFSVNKPALKYQRPKAADLYNAENLRGANRRVPQNRFEELIENLTDRGRVLVKGEPDLQSPAEMAAAHDLVSQMLDVEDKAHINGMEPSRYGTVKPITSPPLLQGDAEGPAQVFDQNDNATNVNVDDDDIIEISDFLEDAARDAKAARQAARGGQTTQAAAIEDLDEATQYLIDMSSDASGEAIDTAVNNVKNAKTPKEAKEASTEVMDAVDDAEDTVPDVNEEEFKKGTKSLVTSLGNFLELMWGSGGGGGAGGMGGAAAGGMLGGLGGLAGGAQPPPPPTQPPPKPPTQPPSAQEPPVDEPALSQVPTGGGGTGTTPELQAQQRLNEALAIDTPEDIIMPEGLVSDAQSALNNQVPPGEQGQRFYRNLIRRIAQHNTFIEGATDRLAEIQNPAVRELRARALRSQRLFTASMLEVLTNRLL